MKRDTQRQGFWHRPLVPAARDGMQWHFYSATGSTACGRWALIGNGRPDDAKERRPSSVKANVCQACERKRK